ncbi:cadherin-like protein 26 [Varanus komodoensis]|uniref:cadherin-like protein 26 n=1 Tax=Varanus komodoensis TaxID=61221 RepID=UPI001CF7A6C8|nr:cadherin-like protein 26 [Varanus komodoensis]
MTIQNSSHWPGSLLNPLGPNLKLMDNLHPLHLRKRRWAITALELEEEDAGPFPKLVGKIFKNVSCDECRQYLIREPEVAAGLFSIENCGGGNLYVHHSIDREKISFLKVRFDIADRWTNKILNRSLYFSVTVKDINDNVPEFSQKEFNSTMTENHRSDLPVFNIIAFDRDEKGSANSRVTYSLVTQRPYLAETVFTVHPSNGQIYISGCSDYQIAKAFQLLVKATDHGTPQRSSTATINIALKDSNNNLPRFTQEKYHLNIPEGEMKHGILRLRVDDQDSPNTPAWRAMYMIISGNEGDNFAIVTDPSTNEGVLSIKKPLIYDSRPERTLVISVENEEAYFLCKGGVVQNVPHLERPKVSVKIYVISRNHAPQFNPPVLLLWQEESVSVGTSIVQYTARDPDGHTIRYEVAFDPNGWVSVDKTFGIVRTVKKLARESLHTNSGVYTIVIHAIDGGVPQLTGTGTIYLLLSSSVVHDPELITPSLNVCQEEGMGPFIIKAEKKHSYAGPFIFELGMAWGNVNNSWKLGKNSGDSVELFMDKPDAQNHATPFAVYAVPVKKNQNDPRGSLHYMDQYGKSSDIRLLTGAQIRMDFDTWTFQRMVEIVKQRCDHLNNLEDKVSYLPHVYAEEGSMGGSDSTWSLPDPYDSDNRLPPDFVDTLGPRLNPLGRICRMERDRIHF